MDEIKKDVDDILDQFRKDCLLAQDAGLDKSTGMLALSSVIHKDKVMALIDSYAEKEVEKAINQGRLEEAEYQLTRRVKGVKRSKYGATIQHGQAYWLQRVKTLKALGGEPEGKPNE